MPTARRLAELGFSLSATRGTAAAMRAAEEAVAAFPGCKRYRTHEEMVNSPDIDAIVIATPDHWHVPISLMALEAGKDRFAAALAFEAMTDRPNADVAPLVQPPTPTWGNMLTDARSYFNVGTHLVIWPGVLIMVTVLCFYLVGDGLRDALDPKSSKD